MAKGLAGKKVLVVCQHYWPENFRISDLCDFFIENNIKVDVLCGIPNYPSGNIYKGYGYIKKRKETHNGVRIFRASEIPRGNNSNFRIFLNYISFPFFSLFQIPKLMKNDYDAVFIYQLSPVYMALPGVIISKLKKIPVTTYVLDLWPENLYSVLQFKNKLVRNFLEYSSHWLYEKADKLIAVSDEMKRKLIDITGSQSVIYIPQVCEKFYEHKIKDKMLEDKYKGKFKLVFTGNISPAQDFKTMVRAAKILVEKGYKDIQWIIVGDGMSKGTFQDLVEENGLQNAFSFEGMFPKEEIPKYTFIADALIGCLAKSDLLEATMPAKVFSYFAAGKPLILAMGGEIADIVNANRLGFAGSPGDYNELAHNIEKVYRLKPSERQFISQSVTKYHRANFDRDRNYKKIIKQIFS